MRPNRYKQYATLFRVRFLTGLQYRAAALAGIATQFAWGGLMVLLYAFPLQARYENPVGRTLKNAVLLAILHLPETLLMAVIYLAVPVVIFEFPNTIPGLALLSIFLGFSGVVYLADLAVYRVFRKTTSEERQA